MSELETFGIETFGADVPESSTSVPDINTDPAALKEHLDELNKQIAATMDPTEQAVLRTAKEVIEKQLAPFAAGKKSEKQWLELSKAYLEAHGNSGEFKKDLAAFGGISDEAFEKMRHALSEFHAAAQPVPSTKRGSKKKGKPEPNPDEGKEGAPLQERWEALLKHAENLGFSAQIVFDELGFTELTDETWGATLREVNNRANPDPKTGEKSEAPSIPPLPPISSAPMIAAPPVMAASASTMNTASPPIWDEVFKRLVDPETGAVVERGYFLEILGWPEMPDELTQEQITQVIDVMHTRFLDPAARYRAQAEKIAGPLEKKAALWEEVFGALFDKYGADHLPKVQKVGSKNFGQFSKKTIDLLSGSISWKKDGGIKCIDEAKFHIWLSERKAELQQLREKGEEGAEEIALLQKTYGLRLVTDVEYSRDKIKELEAGFLPAGWEQLETNEFATRTIK